MKLSNIIVNKKRIRKLHPALMNRKLSRTIVDMNDDDGFDAIIFDETVPPIGGDDSFEESEADRSIFDKPSPGLTAIKTNNHASMGNQLIKQDFSKKKEMNGHSGGPDTK